MYLDGVAYQHKYNPFDDAKSVKSMTCRLGSEGIDRLCTAKGSHTKNGGRIAHFIMTRAFNKEVILCEQYFGKISTEIFANFIHKHFKETFEKINNPKEKLFLQDGHPSQNSRKANNDMYIVGAKKIQYTGTESWH